MLNFERLLNLKIVLLTVAMALFFTSAGYGAEVRVGDTFRRKVSPTRWAHLRVPLGLAAEEYKRKAELKEQERQLGELILQGKSGTCALFEVPIHGKKKSSLCYQLGHRRIYSEYYPQGKTIFLFLVIGEGYFRVDEYSSQEMGLDNLLGCKYYKYKYKQGGDFNFIRPWEILDGKLILKEEGLPTVFHKKLNHEATIIKEDPNNPGKKYRIHLDTRFKDKWVFFVFTDIEINGESKECAIGCSYALGKLSFDVGIICYYEEHKIYVNIIKDREVDEILNEAKKWEVIGKTGHITEWLRAELGIEDLLSEEEARSIFYNNAYLEQMSRGELELLLEIIGRYGRYVYHEKFGAGTIEGIKRVRREGVEYEMLVMEFPQWKMTDLLLMDEFIRLQDERKGLYWTFKTKEEMEKWIEEREDEEEEREELPLPGWSTLKKSLENRGVEIENPEGLIKSGITLAELCCIPRGFMKAYFPLKERGIIDKLILKESEESVWNKRYGFDEAVVMVLNRKEGIATVDELRKLNLVEIVEKLYGKNIKIGKKNVDIKRDMVIDFVKRLIELRIEIKGGYDLNVLESQYLGKALRALMYEIGYTAQREIRTKI